MTPTKKPEVEKIEFEKTLNRMGISPKNLLRELENLNTEADMRHFKLLNNIRKYLKKKSV